MVMQYCSKQAPGLSAWLSQLMARTHQKNPPPKAMPKLLPHSINIKMAFASEIQRDVALRVLRQFLYAWKENVDNAHKENEITITESDS